MLQDSPVLNASVVRDRSQPFEITLTTGSAIVGMTAGTRSGQHGASIRGQTANILILDEADYLSPESIVALEAILRGHVDNELWASSTPTGKREFFYEVCTDKRRGYKEFHYPSSVSPQWTADTERDARLSTLPEAYEHEYEAEFGSLAQGVFNPDFIDVSLRNYSYDDIPMQKKPGNIRMIGVDWNSAKHGTQIAVIEFSRVPTEYVFQEGEKLVNTRVINKFTLIHRLEITEKHLTQHKAIMAILKMMTDYQIDHLYVDEGYGAAAIEALYLEGKKYPNLDIKNKLKAFNLSSKITIRDPMTKRPVEKPIKPYMVEQSKLRVEEESCIFPESEDYPTGIVGQMRAYLILRWSTTGYPTYSVENEHALDAWMIGMLGFEEEYSELKRAKIATNVHTVAPDRMQTFNDKIDRLGTKDEKTYTSRDRPNAVVEALRQNGMLDETVYTGWDDTLHDDSDKAVQRRKNHHDNHHRNQKPGGSPWRNRRTATVAPSRVNITINHHRTPWSR
jgi:replicative DNA helicase